MPQWRLALGNMAAGGTAGALVEAGELLVLPVSDSKTFILHITRRALQACCHGKVIPGRTPENAIKVLLRFA